MYIYLIISFSIHYLSHKLYCFTVYELLYEYNICYPLLKHLTDSLAIIATRSSSKALFMTGIITVRVLVPEIDTNIFWDYYPVAAIPGFKVKPTVQVEDVRVGTRSEYTFRCLFSPSTSEVLHYQVLWYANMKMVYTFTPRQWSDQFLENTSLTEAILKARRFESPGFTVSTNICVFWLVITIHTEANNSREANCKKSALKNKLQI